MTSPLSIVFKRGYRYRNSLLLFIDFVTHVCVLHICIYTCIYESRLNQMHTVDGFPTFFYEFQALTSTNAKIQDNLYHIS